MTMLIGGASINSLIAALVALSIVACAPGAPAQTEEGGSKAIRMPTKARKDAPCIDWMPPDNVKLRAAMLCVHGFSLHKGCFAAFGKEMAKGGIATYALDLRGFGESKDTTGHTELDFDGCLVDIKTVLEQIHNSHPDLPVIILGESMGGAIALRATALYPNLISGLISAVPARDRFAFSESERKLLVKSGLQSVFGGFTKPIDNAAMAAVQKISGKQDVRDEWKNDPLMRTAFSPKEFVQFDKFMPHNLEAASLVKNTPVLFIQGTNDKLIRPAGTWKLFERLSTPNRQIVLSNNSEHLIFEEGQFRPDDLEFVLTWIDRNVSHLDPHILGALDKLPVVASKEEYAGTQIVNAANSEPATNIDELAAIPPPPAASEFKHRIDSDNPRQISYWIELYREGKIYRCNNKMAFKSGDSIRFHLIPECDGYAYLIMKASTTGKSDVLFPNASNGTQNYMKKGHDYPMPYTGWMQFDQNPGTELLGLMFAQEQIDVTPQNLQNLNVTCYVSTGLEGSKDLCPTRMKLSWDDPTPVMIPDDFVPVSQVASSVSSSLVRLVSTTGEMVSANIQLVHGK